VRNDQSKIEDLKGKEGVVDAEGFHDDSFLTKSVA
jgi:hypothetical protein